MKYGCKIQLHMNDTKSVAKLYTILGCLPPKTQKGVLSIKMNLKQYQIDIKLKGPLQNH